MNTPKATTEARVEQAALELPTKKPYAPLEATAGVCSPPTGKAEPITCTGRVETEQGADAGVGARHSRKRVRQGKRLAIRKQLAVEEFFSECLAPTFDNPAFVRTIRGMLISSLAAYLPHDRRVALARGETIPARVYGAALCADISGFTSLAESLSQTRGASRGAEELMRRVNVVYDALIARVHAYRGSVIGFSGDAITCFFEEEMRDERGEMRASHLSSLLDLLCVRRRARWRCKARCARFRNWRSESALPREPRTASSSAIRRFS